MKKRRFIIHALGCTLFVYAFMGLIAILPATFEFLNPLSDAVSDIEVTDVIFSKLRDERTDKETGLTISNVPVDTNIVLVNIGELDNEQLAQEIDIINAQKPKVIAIDATFFNVPGRQRNGHKDSVLAESFSHVKSLVLANKLIYREKSHKLDSVIQPIPLLRQYAKTAYVNLITVGSDGVSATEQLKTSRDITPKEIIDDSAYLSFPVFIASLINPQAAKAFLARNNTTEVINYTRRQTDYFALDVADVFNPDLAPDIFTNKVVLLGFMGRYFADPTYEDKFFTPMNAKYAGKSLHDMYGVVIHANVISMITEQNYINEMPVWECLLVGLLLCFLNVLYFLYVNIYLGHWYDLITKSIQFIESVFVIFLVVIIFDKLHYKIDLTIGIAAVLLCGDLLEVYTTLTKNIFGETEQA